MTGVGIVGAAIRRSAETGAATPAASESSAAGDASASTPSIVSPAASKASGSAVLFAVTVTAFADGSGSVGADRSAGCVPIGAA